MIASSAAPHYILTWEQMRDVIGRRRNRPMFLIDIAVPRNIEPAVNELDNVFLYDIDDLDRVVQTNCKGRIEVAEQAEEIIREEVERMMLRLKSREVTPTIVKLQEQLGRWRANEIERKRAKLGRADAAAGGSHRGASRAASSTRSRTVPSRSCASRRPTKAACTGEHDPQAVPAGGRMSGRQMARGLSATRYNAVRS